MKRLPLFTLFLCVAWILTLIGSILLYRDILSDRNRLRHNQSILLHNGNVHISETPTGQSHASVPVLNIRSSEFRKSSNTLVKVARQVGAKTSRISEAATTATTTHADIVAPIKKEAAITISTDSMHHPDSLVCFSWNDAWMSLSGCVTDNTFRGSISSSDTLDIIVHRVPKRFLFFRFGCREVRMDVVSRNPHTRLTYARNYQFTK